MREGETSTESQDDPEWPAKDTCARHGFLNESGRRRYWALPRCLALGFTAREGLLGAVASPPPLATPSPPSPRGWNGNGARGLFEAVEWKIDFNPLCGD